MNRNNEPPKRGGIVGSRWGPPPPPQGNADTKAKDALKTLGDEYQNQGSMSQGTAGGKKANPAQPAVKAAQNKGGFTGQDARAYGGPNMAIKPGAFPVNKPTLAPPAPKFAQNTGGFTSQDARAGGGPNMAIQRDAQAPQVKVSLKKGAVKVAAPAPAAARRPKAPSPLGQDPLYTVPEAPESTPYVTLFHSFAFILLTIGSAPTPSASKEAPKMIPVEEKEAVNVIRERPLNTAASSTPKKASKNEDDDSLHALFAKLKAGSPAIPSATGSATKKAPLSASAFVFETLDKGDKGDKGDKVDKKAGGIEKQDMFGVKSVQGDVASSKSAKEVPGDKPEAADASKGTVKHENAVPSKIAKPETANTSDTADEKTTATAEPPYMSGKNLEKQYLAKALEYVQALSGAEETPSWLLSTVTRKLRQTFKPNGPQDVEKLQSAVGEAIATYLNGLSNGKESDMKPKDAVQLLKANGGDFLKFNSDLTEQKFISLENLDDAIGLCKAILKALPDSDKKKPALPVFPVYKDPMDDMKAWPNALKRDNLPGCRTIMIKGVGDLKTVHQVQALVWGGAVESIHPAETGKDFAMIKFMTAAGCRKYFDTTENGIEVPNTKKVVFVERQPGPNSVNDVLQNCIDGNVTRCVRALGADEDWSAMALRKLAEGSDPKKKRQLDFVKRGKTARGVSGTRSF